MYVFLDKFFLFFHTFLILFNLFGWMWKKTRRANLATLLLTAFSWGVLGLWKGFGYCPCTDWHWQVRRHLGYDGLPASYVKFLVDVLFGWDAPAALVDGATLGGFLLALAASIYVNVRAERRREA